MKRNRKADEGIILTLGYVHAASANHAMREFTVRCFLPSDMYSEQQSANNSDLEEILNDLRNHIAVCWSNKKVTRVYKEGDEEL